MRKHTFSKVAKPTDIAIAAAGMSLLFGSKITTYMRSGMSFIISSHTGEISTAAVTASVI